MSEEPVNIALWLTPLAGLLLFVIDRPSSWGTPLWRSWLVRVLGAGFATAMLIAYVTVSPRYGSQHWVTTALSLGLGWITFAAVTARAVHQHSAQRHASAQKTRDGLRTFTSWIGISHGIFYIPAAALSAAGTLLMVLPLYGTFLTGLVLLLVDPPRRWPHPQFASLWMRILASGTAALLFAATESVYRDTRTHEVFIGDWRESLTFCMGAWGLYAVAAGVAYLMRDRSHQHASTSGDKSR